MRLSLRHRSFPFIRRTHVARLYTFEMNKITTGIRTLPDPLRGGDAILLGEKLGENDHTYVPVIPERDAKIHRRTVKYGTFRKWPENDPNKRRFSHYCIAKKVRKASLTSVILRVHTRWTTPISSMSAWMSLPPGHIKPIISVTVRGIQGGWMDSLVEMKDGDIIAVNLNNRRLPTRYVIVQKFRGRSLQPIVLTPKDMESYTP